MTRRLLVVEDDDDLRNELVRCIEKAGHEACGAARGEEALGLFRERDFDVVLTDLNMRGMSGIELCRELLAIRADIPVIVMTAFGSVEAAVGAMRSGAYDFLSKPVTSDMLDLVVARALRQAELERRIKSLLAVGEGRELDGALLGNSPPARALRELVARIAASDATALILGESGAGKDVVARTIHRQSRRASAPFVAVNCASIPGTLLESELFGHEKGAFTDASQSRRGLFREADGGTLFLDEIAELPLPVQAKLLRVLETRSIRPVGGDREVSVDVRILAATNRDLRESVRHREFREDLYYRLDVVSVDVPPLRARGDDIVLLASSFLAQAAEQNRRTLRLGPSFVRAILAYDWPGNVRELRNAIERAVALARFDELAEADLPARVLEHRSDKLVFTSDDELVTLAELEGRYIRSVLERVGGNKARAVEVLGIDRSTLYRKLERLGLELPSSDRSPSGPSVAKRDESQSAPRRRGSREP